MTSQATIFDFAPKALPIKGWAHENGGRGWIYRSNAEASIKDLGKLPSGAGLWPRFMATPTGRWPGREDIRHWQQCGDGGIHKEIWYDGTVRDRLQIGYGTPDECKRVGLCDAWIDGDTMHVIGDDGIERTLEVIEDSEASRYDVHPFDPARIPEHYLLLAMHNGLRGEMAKAMAHMPYDFSACAPTTEAMDAVYATYDLTHVIPMCDHAVPRRPKGCRWSSRCRSWARCP